MAKSIPPKKTVETLTHDEATRRNIPTAEYQSVMKASERSPLRVAYERRNRDLDPQLVWRARTSKTGPTSSSASRRERQAAARNPIEANRHACRRPYRRAARMVGVDRVESGSVRVQGPKGAFRFEKYTARNPYRGERGMPSIRHESATERKRARETA